MSSIVIDRRLFPSEEFHSPNPGVFKLSATQLELVNEFNSKVKDGIIEFEEVPCLCKGTKFDLIATFDRYGFSQNTVVCQSCGLLLSNPRMTEEAAREFYSSDFYRQAYEHGQYKEIYKNKYVLSTGQDIFDEINKVMVIKPSTSILEFGAGGGWNLLPFIGKGASVVGVDLSPSLVELGISNGIPMRVGAVEDIIEKYDVIILNHVLEHFYDPIKQLASLSSHLSSDGIIYIAVPNIHNFHMGQIQNAHTYYFSPATFNFYCQRSGLTSIKLGRSEHMHMFGVFKLNSSNIVDNNLPSVLPTYSIIKRYRLKSKVKKFLRCIYLDKPLLQVWYTLRRVFS